MCLSCAAAAAKQAAQPILVPPDPAEFVVFASRLDDDMRELARRFAAGELSVERWMQEFDALLKAGHTDAHLIGQRAAGGFEDVATARFWGGYFAQTEAQYMQGFALDLLAMDPRYFGEDGEWRADAMHNRMRLYLGKTRGTAGYGFVHGSPPGSQYDWELMALEDHCEDCPVIAAGGPYTKETLYTTPGAGDTPCLGNCKCRLVRKDGAVGIDPLLYAA